MKQITDRDFKALEKELDRAYSGLDEYASRLSDTYVCYCHLDKIYEILQKYKAKKESK
jgi:hypothetical protein